MGSDLVTWKAFPMRKAKLRSVSFPIQRTRVTRVTRYVLGHKSGLKRDDGPSNHHADARSPGQPTPPFIPETLSVRGRDIIAALSNDRLVSKH